MTITTPIEENMSNNLDSGTLKAQDHTSIYGYRVVMLDRTMVDLAYTALRTLFQDHFPDANLVALARSPLHPYGIVIVTGTKIQLAPAREIFRQTLGKALEVDQSTVLSDTLQDRRNLARINCALLQISCLHSRGLMCLHLADDSLEISEPLTPLIFTPLAIQEEGIKSLSGRLDGAPPSGPASLSSVEDQLIRARNIAHDLLIQDVLKILTGLADLNDVQDHHAGRPGLRGQVLRLAGRLIKELRP